MPECQIVLKNYQGAYHPRDNVDGRLECYFEEDTAVESIKVEATFFECNKWTRPGRYRRITYQNQINTSLSTYQFQEERILPKGTHCYDFSFVLPDDLPSSYYGPYGKIAYKLEAIVELRWTPLKQDCIYMMEFKVVSPIDFNRKPPELQYPASYSDQKSICCLFCRGGNISIDVQINKKAFVPGEVIKCKVDVSNLSNTNVKALRVTLKKRIQYSADFLAEDISYKEILAEVEEHGVGAHGEHTYNLELPIPEDVEIPNFQSCDLYHVAYKLIVECVIPSWHLNLSIEIKDIQLGHVQRIDLDSTTNEMIERPPLQSNQANGFSGNPSERPESTTLPPPQLESGNHSDID